MIAVSGLQGSRDFGVCDLGIWGLVVQEGIACDCARGFFAEP